MAVLEEEYGHIRDEILYNLDMEDGATRDLLALYFDADTTSAELAAFYKKHNFEKLSYQCVWLLVRLSFQMHYEGVPAELLPRVKGAVRKFAVENGVMLCELAGILSVFNRIGLDVLLLKGAAMKVHYDPTGIRVMGDIDFLVHPHDLEKAFSVLKERGFHVESYSSHHITCRKGTVLMELHRVCIHENILKGDPPSIWNTAKEISWRGKKVFVPCPEVMLMILLVHISEDARSVYFRERIGSLIKWVVDARFFIDKYLLDWELFVKIVRENDLNMNIRLMLDMLNQLYPGMIDEKILNAFPVTRKDMDNQRKLRVYATCWNRMMDAKEADKRLLYYWRGFFCMWHRSRFMGKHDSLLEDIIEFPHFLDVWSGQKGLWRFVNEKLHNRKKSKK